MAKRVFLTVLDSFGVGEAPDAARFGDTGTNTLLSCSKSEKFRLDNFRKLGLFNIDGVSLPGADSPLASYGRLQELSNGKDTTIGHWEISGLISDRPLPTYPDGFPDEVIAAFTEKTGRGVLCNKPYSGTEVIKDYGEKHLETGGLIVYTSADSVFQIAANESIVPVEQLYDYCRAAREILTGDHAVGRVIARPFIGDSAENFTRTAKRHDFSVAPPAKTLLDYVSGAGLDSIAVGKIFDIFSGSGITRHTYTAGNTEGIEKTLEYINTDFSGLCFINLVDFDSLYGHRRDIDGYAAALTEYDSRLPEMLASLRDDDLFIVTADHGCDPGFTKTTDHTREYVPLIVYSKRGKAVDLGTRSGFCGIARTVCDYLGVENDLCGESFLNELF